MANIEKAQQRRLIFRIGIVLVLGLAVTIAAYGVHEFTSPQQPTNVIVSRFAGNDPTFHIVPFDRTSTKADKVQRLYNTIFHLPVANPGVMCGPNPESYLLTFYQGKHFLLSVTAQAGGCGFVDLNRGNQHDSYNFVHRMASDEFWSEMAQALGVSRTTIVPTSY